MRLLLDTHIVLAIVNNTVDRLPQPLRELLLAQASVEGMRLVTLDRALAAHPLAWAPTPP